MFGWVRVSIDGTTYSHVHQPQRMSCGATSLAMLVWNCGYGLGSESVARWTIRGIERERTGRTVLSDPDPMDDIGTHEKRVAGALRDYYGLTAKTIGANGFQKLIAGSPADWTSFVVGVLWDRGGGHLITVIVRGSNALIFDPGEAAGRIHKVACSSLAGGPKDAHTLGQPGIAKHVIDWAVHVPPQGGAAAFARNIAQSGKWVYDVGRTGFPKLW